VTQAPRGGSIERRRETYEANWSGDSIQSLPAKLTTGGDFAHFHFERGVSPELRRRDGSGWHGLTEGESVLTGRAELIAKGADLLRIGRDLLAAQQSTLTQSGYCLGTKTQKIICVGLQLRMTTRGTRLKSRSIPKFCALRDPSDRAL